MGRRDKKVQTPHTYHLWELTNKGNSDEVYELAQMAAELYTQDRVGALGAREWDDDAKAIVYAVHRRMWEGRKIADSTRPPITHRTAAATSMKAIIKSVIPNWYDLWGDDDGPTFKRMSSNVYFILAGNQMIRRLGRGGKTSVFYLREWPAGFAPNYYDRKQGQVWFSVKDEADLARQEAKAEKLAGPVKIVYNVNAIPLPEPNPQSVMDYLNKLRGLIEKLQAENAELRHELDERDGWSQVVEAIKRDSVSGASA